MAIAEGEDDGNSMQEGKVGSEEAEGVSSGKYAAIYCDDWAFLALDTLSTASLMGLRPFKTVICALRYGAGSNMCISSDAVGPPSPTLSPSIEGK